MASTYNMNYSIDMVENMCKNRGMGDIGEISVSDIEDKILLLKEEMQEITLSPPYTLKPYITDPIIGNEKRIELEEELDKYVGYNDEKVILIIWRLK